MEKGWKYINKSREEATSRLLETVLLNKKHWIASHYCSSNSRCVDQPGWTSTNSYVCACNSGYENWRQNQGLEPPKFWNVKSGHIVTGCSNINECCNKANARCTHSCTKTAPILESARTSRGDTTAGPAAWQVRGFWFYTLNKIIQAVNTLPTLGPSRATAPGPATMEATGGRIIISSTYSTLTYYSILIIAQKIRVSDGKRVRLTFTNFWVCMNICIVYRKI